MLYSCNIGAPESAANGFDPTIRLGGSRLCLALLVVLEEDIRWPTASNACCFGLYGQLEAVFR